MKGTISNRQPQSPPAAVMVSGRRIGPGEPCYVIAEAGVNHNGDLGLAHRLIDKAASAGADAVKFQAFNTADLVTRHAEMADYQVETTGRSQDQYAMLKDLELSPAHHRELKTHCQAAGVEYLCTPYDPASAEMLDRLEVAAFKIASTDTTNIPLLHQIAAKGRPVILSTGMCSLDEVVEAVDALDMIAGKLILLHCTTEYPLPPAEANLRAITTLRDAFAIPVGYSDHSSGIGLAPWAVALGACVIEKHLTLDRAMVGPDHRASIEPPELEDLVKTLKLLELALGDGVKRPMPAESSNKARMQRSLVAGRDIRAGARITAADLACKRPATGLPPKWYSRILGRRARVAIPRDAILTLDLFEAEDRPENRD